MNRVARDINPFARNLLPGSYDKRECRLQGMSMEWARMPMRPRACRYIGPVGANKNPGLKGRGWCGNRQEAVWIKWA